MVQVCPKCNTPMTEDHMVEICTRDGFKMLSHYICPVGAPMAKHASRVTEHTPKASPVQFKEVEVSIMISDDGDFVIADQDQDVSCVWDESYSSPPTCAQIYVFRYKIPIPQFIKYETVTVTPEMASKIIMEIKGQ